MLIPVCCERLPVKLELCVVSARGLPVMNKSINCTEAFVQIRFDDTVEKTDVITSLDPVWNSEYFEYDTDEKQLSEELVEFRVMDHDTYTTNDAIGRVDLDCNILVQSMRLSGEHHIDHHIVLPIWDTLNGDVPPEHLLMVEVVGLVGAVRVEKDPEYEWLDRIRTPRATNESRQWALRYALRMAAIEVAEKAHKAGAQVVLAYQESIDIEGSPTDSFCIRAFGTAVIVASKTDKVVFNPQLTYPIVTMGSLPLEWYEGCGPIVASRCVLVCEESENIETIRKRQWAELRNEIFQQATAVGCNIIIGYIEEVRIHDGLGVFCCTGTAIRYGPKESEEGGSIYNEKPIHNKEEGGDFSCVQYHAAFDPAKMPFCIKLFPCNWCKKELCADIIMSTVPCPPTQLIHGSKHYVQLLPCIDRDLFNLLITEGKTVNAQANAFFQTRRTTTIDDGCLVGVLTAVLVRLNTLQDCVERDELSSPVIQQVLSFHSLQRHNDSRRFSWGTMREAIRLKPVVQVPAITAKILHLKRSAMEPLDEESRLRGRLHTLVGRMKKRQYEKEYISHIVMERNLTLSVGVVEAAIASHSSAIAGVHIAPPLVSLVLNREQSVGAKFISRWRQVYIKEDNSGGVRDAQSLDLFVGVCLDECLGLARGSLSACSGTSFTNFNIPTTQLVVSRDQAQILVLFAADLVTNA